MGTWGPRTFDDDCALDELGARPDKLVNSILTSAKQKKSREYDEYDHTVLFVDFEFAFALDAKGLLRPSVLPTPDEVDYLRADFVEEWELYYRRHAGAAEEDIKKRKKCIINTFNRFWRICKKEHQKRPS